jgi:catechol 2,3-dioxygenase-like lactoylglutathione lyase family enzyme
MSYDSPNVGERKMKFSAGEINIICSDLGKSLSFYRDILGFVLVEREENACRLKCGDTCFLLLPVAESQSAREPYCSEPTISFDLMVDDIEKANIYFKKHEVEFESEWEPGSPRLFIRDPDGLVIEIIKNGK